MSFFLQTKPNPNQPNINLKPNELQSSEYVYKVPFL